jgi:hypothetical protein
MLTLPGVTVPTGCQSFHLGKAVVFQSSFRGMPVYVKSKFGFRILIVLIVYSVERPDLKGLSTFS